MILTEDHLQILLKACQELQQGFTPVTGSSTPSRLEGVLLDTARRLHDNYPYQSPLYLGQMLKPPHPVAQLTYALAMCLNPNNHAHDGGRASSELEKECIRALGDLVDWDRPLGHLCGGGTMGNLEAHWVGRELTGGSPIAASQQAHYTHERLAGVLGVPFQSVRTDSQGRMDLNHLEEILRRERIGVVVATLGTTALGAVDPLHEIKPLQDRYGFRLHVDAAYGGYFRLASNLAPSTRRAFEAMSEADSIVIDPHKHGLQPYGCGCVLFRDPEVARVYRHDSPYTYFTSNDLHLGEISLECSRPGAAAVALWATMQLLPLVPAGEFARGLEQGREAALRFADWLRESDHFSPVIDPELDIVVWTVAGATATECSQRARRVFEEAARRDLHLALVTLPRTLLEPANFVANWDFESMVCLRSCLMKPEHLIALPEIQARLTAAHAAAL